MYEILGIVVMLFIGVGIVDIYMDFKLKKIHKKLDDIEQLCRAVNEEQTRNKK